MFFPVRDTLHAAIFHCVSTFMPLSELEKEALLLMMKQTQMRKILQTKTNAIKNLYKHTAHLERKFMQ